MKHVFMLMLGLFVLFPGAQAQNVPASAPTDPGFIKFINEFHSGKAQTLTKSGHTLGLIPHPVGPNFNNYTPAQAPKTFPAVYDLRTTGYLTSVKNQGTCGSCWSFATMGAVESQWLRQGLSAFDLSENNLIHCHNFEWNPCDGGNYFMSMAYLSRRAGPVLETSDPYTQGAGICTTGITPQAYVTDARFLPDDVNVIKQAIMDYGALYTNMYYGDPYYNSGNYTYYYNDTLETNHAVLLVGWDDTKVTAGGTGAWIIRNSWGTSWGQSGYFYISYNDSKINSGVAYFPVRMDYNSNSTVYGYDELGHLTNTGYGSNTAYGLVKFVSNGSQPLTHIGTWVNTSNSTVTINIYDTFSGGSLTNPLGSVSTQSCPFPGYYTFALSSPINITNGNDFYIKVRYDTPGYGYPIPCEAAIGAYAAPVIESGKCWISQSGGTSWLAIGSTTDYHWDLCIKAYAATAATGIDPDPVAPKNFSLHQNYPNPFNPSTSISYDLPRTCYVTLKIFSTLGQEIATLTEGMESAGRRSVVWNGRDNRGCSVASGIYIYELKAGDFRFARKLLFLK